MKGETKPVLALAERRSLPPQPSATFDSLTALTPKRKKTHTVPSSVCSPPTLQSWNPLATSTTFNYGVDNLKTLRSFRFLLDLLGIKNILRGEFTLYLTCFKLPDTNTQESSLYLPHCSYCWYSVSNTTAFTEMTIPTTGSDCKSFHFCLTQLPHV